MRWGEYYEPEVYKGYKITFQNRGNRRVFARVPEITLQYLAISDTKDEAYTQVRREIDGFLKAGTIRNKSKDGRGWHGDSAGHSKAARKR